MKSLLLLGALILLCGCQDTTFESQPSKTVADCDARFVGTWRLLPAENNGSKDELFVIVEPACKRWRFIDDGKDDVNTENEVRIAFATVADKPLLIVKNEEKHEYAHNDPKWHEGYMYLRYVFADGDIRLYPVDDKRVAHWIVDGKVKGRTETITQSPGSTRHEGELHNFVAGDSDEMARVAQLDGIFSSSRHYTLKPASVAEVFKGGEDPEHP